MLNPIDDDKNQPEYDRKESEDVERAKGQRLVSPLPDQDRPNVDARQDHQKGVQSNEHVPLHRVDNELCLSEFRWFQTVPR